MSFLKITLIFSFLLSIPFAGVDFTTSGIWEFSDIEKAAHVINDLEFNKVQVYKRQATKFHALPFSAQSLPSEFFVHLELTPSICSNRAFSPIGRNNARAPPQSV